MADTASEADARYRRWLKDAAEREALLYGKFKIPAPGVYREDMYVARDFGFLAQPNVKSAILTKGERMTENKQQMAETEMKIAEARDARTNAMKKSRGDFIHGANWMAKWIRDNPENRPYQTDPLYGIAYIRGGTVFPSKAEIEQAARERFPIRETRDRIVRVEWRTPGSIGSYSEVRYIGLKGGRVKFYADPDGARYAVIPPMYPEIVKAMADLIANPTEEVEI